MLWHASKFPSICFHLDSLDLTWTHLESLDLPWIPLISFISRERERMISQGKRDGISRPKGKGKRARVSLKIHSDLTYSCARTHKRNETISQLTHPPTSNKCTHTGHVYNLYVYIYILDIQIYIYIYNIIYTGTHLLTPPPSLIAIAIRCIYIYSERERERIQDI